MMKGHESTRVVDRINDFQLLKTGAMADCYKLYEAPVAGL